MDAFWAIVGPPIASVEGVEMFDVTVQPILRELAAVLLQAEIGKYSKP